MKILYANEDDFALYADPDSPRRPMVQGGVFRNANRWDGVPELCEEVLIAPNANQADHIAAVYEEFEWRVAGKFPGTTQKKKATVTLLNEKVVSRARKQNERGRNARLDVVAPEAPESSE